MMKLLLAAATIVAAVACQQAIGLSASPNPPAPIASPGSPATGTTPASTPVAPEASAPQPESTQTTPTRSLPASVINPIVADAAARTRVESASIGIMIAESVSWPDRGLGCPIPGVNYPQVPVDGYQVVVDAGGQRLDYRGSGADDFRLCTTTRVVPEASMPGDRY